MNSTTAPGTPPKGLLTDPLADAITYYECHRSVTSINRLANALRQAMREEIERFHVEQQQIGAPQL
jgi:hypothetical protein